MATITSKRTRRTWLMTAPVVLGAIAAAAATRPAAATGEDVTELHERCATRLSVAFLGKTATDAQLASTDPQASVDSMLQDPAFIERFARFTNASFNDGPGATPEEDAPYFLAKYVLANGKPWSDMFLGPYKVDRDATGQVVVTNDPNGLGYFRSRPWLVRYAGNEAAGIKISTAYRIMNNVMGLRLTASTNAPSVDISATGRLAAPCNGCHYTPWFALDHVAAVLTKRVGSGDAMTFLAPTAGPQKILGGLTIANDQELVSALVANDGFKFRTCRMAFQFLYGRPENKCEGPTFDRCIDELSAKKTVQSALAAVAKDPSFCQ
jgi:hypothetical protein